MNQIMTAEDLLGLKKKIETAKEQLAQLKGQEIQLMSRLKEEWGCNTIAEAEKKLAAMGVEITNMGLDIQEAQEQLRIDFPQLFEE